MEPKLTDCKMNESPRQGRPPVFAYVTLPNEQIRNEPLPQGGGFEKMARRRYQKPTPKKRGDQWTILVREDFVESGQRSRKVRRVPLGPSTLTKAEAERLRDEHLENINQANVGIGGAILSRDFARIYERDVLPTMAETTRDRSKSVLKVHLVPEFGDRMLRELSVEVLQGYFARLQVRYPEPETVDKIRDVMSGLLQTAVNYGRLKTNPMDKVRLKKRKLNKLKPFIRVHQFYALLELIAEPYATMIYVEVFAARRVSELAGLRWRNVHSDSITIEQRFSRGDWDEPKSRASQATIAVDDHVIARIQKLNSLELVVRAGRASRCYRAVKSDGPDDLVFQSPVKGAPMRDNNILVRHIKPVGRELGIGWVNWQVLRRSCATWLDQANVNVKDAQGLMRHSRASTTQDVYQQVVPESQRKAVRKLTEYVRASSKAAMIVQ